METMRDKQLIHRILIYNLGLLILAFGVAFAINSELGTSPISSLPFVISLIAGTDTGVCVAIVFASFILIQILILRKEFKWINLSQIVFSSIFGYFVDFARSVLGDLRIPTYAGQLCMLGISLVLVAYGIAMYVEAGLVNMPTEGLMVAIAHKKQAAFHNVKIKVDCVVVSISVALSLVFLGGLHGVREGTIISAVFVGKLMPVMRKIIIPVLRGTGFKINDKAER